MSDRRSIIVEGSVIGFAKGCLDGGHTGADPAVLKDTVGVTWDVLDECVAYGLRADMAQKLFGVRTFSRGDAVRAGEYLQPGNDGVREQRIGPAGAGDRRHLAEVEQAFFLKHAPKDLVHRHAGTIWSRLRTALSYLVHGDVALQPGHERGKPRTFTALLGEFEQDGGRRILKRLDDIAGYPVIPIIFARHPDPSRPHKVLVVRAESETQLDHLCESAIRDFARAA